MFEIIELDQELRAARQGGQGEDRYVARVAARTKQRSQDIARLVRENYTSREIALITNVPLSVIETHVAEIERHNEAMAEFQRTGEMPSSGGYYAIFQP